MQRGLVLKKLKQTALLNKKKTIVPQKNVLERNVGGFNGFTHPHPSNTVINLIFIAQQVGNRLRLTHN